MTERSNSSITILAVAVAGIVTVATSEGQFTLWNLMVGLILVFVLSCYKVSKEMQVSERLALAATWSFVIIIALGVGLQWFYDLLSCRYAAVFPARKPNYEGPSVYYFFCWLVLAIAAYILINREQKSLANERNKEGVD